MNIGVVIQARLGSTRLPSKVVKFIGGTTMLEHCWARCVAAGFPVYLAIPTTEEEESDVLARYYRIATESFLDVIIRVTSDCPLIPPYEIERCFGEFILRRVDYLTNRPNVPDGWDVEVMTYGALYRAFHQAKDSYDREHVTPFIKRDKSLAQAILEDPKLSVDTESDLENVRRFHELERKANLGHGRYGFLCDELYKVRFVSGDKAKDYSHLQQG